MAKDVILNLRIDTKNGEKSVGSLNKEFNTTLVTMREMEEASQAITEALKDTKVGTEQYKRLSEELINVNTELKNQELALEALDHEQVASEIKSVVGGLTDMAGGMALVGVSGQKMEKVVQTFAKIEGVSKLVTGAMEGYNSMMKLQGTIAKVTTGWTNALAAAQLKGGIAAKAASVGMGILNAVMALNPIFLIIIALAALVAGLAWFMSSTDDAAEAQAAFNKELEAERAELDKNNAALQKNADHKLALAQIVGASSEELHKLTLNKLAVEEKARKANIALEKKEIATKRKLYTQALENGEDEVATSLREEITESRGRYKTLVAQNGDYNRAKILENAKYAETVKKENAQEIADNKAKNDQQIKDDEKALATRISNYKKYISNRRAAEKILADLNQTLGGDEITANDLKYDRLIAKTTQNENMLQSEKLEIIKRYELLRDIDELKILSERKKKAEEAEKKKNDAIAAAQIAADQAMYDRQDEQFAALQELQNTATENQINGLVLASEEKIAMAEGNAELIKAIEAQLAKDILDIQKAAAAEEERLRQEKVAAITASAEAAVGAIGAAIDGSFAEINESFSLLNETLFNEETGLFAKMTQGSLTAMEAVQIGIAATMEVISAVMEANAQKASAEREESYSAEASALQASLNNREISQKEYNAKIAMLEAKKAQKEKMARLKAFKQQKAMAIVNAVMSTAQAVIQGMANAFPLNIVMAALAGALGVAQIAVIASQKFTGNRGGVVPGTASKHDSVDAKLAPGEAVINSESSMMFPTLLSEINKAGGGIPLAPEPVPTLTGGGGGNSVFSPGGGGMVKAYVVESEMTNSQNRVGRMERSAEF